MKPTRRKWLIAALILLAAIAAFFLGPGRGPRYNGKRLSYWFREYYLGLEDNRRKPGANKSLEAIRSMGTNALPYLLEQAFSKKEDTAFRSNYYDCLKQFPASWHVPRFVSQAEIHAVARHSIHEINPPPDLLLAMLQPHLQANGTPEFRAAIEILGDTTNQIESFVPYYARAVLDSNHQIFSSAINTLRNLGPAAASALPDLIRWMETATPGPAVVSVAITLGAIGSNAAPAIPLLKTRFNSEPNTQFRCMFAASLYKIDSDQTEAMDFLLGILRTGNPREIRYAVSALGDIGEKARAAIPDLARVMAQSGFREWPSFLEALQKMHAPGNSFMPLLSIKTKSLNESESFQAAKMILSIEPGNHESQSIMVSAIESHSTNEQGAIIALGVAGTNALAAVPALLRVFDGTNEASWTFVPDALGKIHPPKESVIPQLKDKLRSPKEPNARLQFELTTSILELDPADPLAIAIMIEIARFEWAYSRVAIQALGRAGPAAKQAVPVLREALKSDDDNISGAAETALKRIEAKPAK